MKLLIWLPSLCSLLLLLNSCANKNANDPNGTGPFDANGAYREDLADDPSKWTRPGKRAASSAMVKNDQPPANANPLTSSQSSNITKIAPTVDSAALQAEATRKAQASKASAERKAEAAREAAAERKAEAAREAAAERKAAAKHKTSAARKAEAEREAAEERKAEAKRKAKGKSETTSKTKEKVASTSSKSKKTPEKAKTTTKAKKDAHYTVKKGDTIEGIAKRNGSTASKIRKANKISGDIIRPGQTLTIPKE